MKGLLYLTSALAVIATASWAYRENYRTQDSLREVRRLNAEIATTRVRLNMLNAEWAYQNRPDRLRELADLNFDRLGLLPMQPGSFGHVSDVPEALPDVLPLGPITDSVTLSGQTQRLNPGEEPL